MKFVPVALLFVFLMLFTPGHGAAQALKNVLVVYDTTGSTAWKADLAATQLRNLLSHFNTQVVSHPVESYLSNESASYDVVFYVGMTTSTVLNQNFILDVLNTNTKFFWINNNLQKIATGATQADFLARFGVAWVKTDTTPDWTSVAYKGVDLPRTSWDMGIVTLEQRADAEVIALAKSVAASTTPYILRSKNLYYIADNPFWDVVYADRALAFCDVLHDVLESGVAESHKAVLRIEDVHTHQDPAQLRAIADYLYAEKIPFVISVIPQYEDPRHVYETPYSSTWTDAPELLAAVKYMTNRGGRVIMHGYTHQYSNLKNPESGVTAEDWEFYRVTRKTDGSLRFAGFIPEDSVAWATDRMAKGLALLKKSGLYPVAWLTPHYMASPTDYAVFVNFFALALDRGVYYAQDANGAYHFAEQYAPYTIERDIYGTVRLPETCNYISPYEVPPRLPSDAARLASLVKVVRDGWAGCYFHPFLDIEYLKQLVTGIKAEGYTFVPVGKAPPVVPVGGIAALLLQ